jgi:hypothetical protein
MGKVGGARGGNRAVGFEPRAVHQKDVSGGGVEVVLVEPGAGAPHGLHEAQAGELGGAPDESDLSRALDAPQLVQDGREIANLDAGEAALQEPDEMPLARKTAVPVIGRDAGVRRKQLAPALALPLGGAEGRVERGRRPLVETGRPVGFHQLGAVNRVGAGQSFDQLPVIGGENLAFAALEPLVARRQIQADLARSSIEKQVRVGRLYTREVIKRVRLSRYDEAIHLGRALNDGERVVSHRVEELVPAGSKLLGREIGLIMLGEGG